MSPEEIERRRAEFFEASEKRKTVFDKLMACGNVSFAPIDRELYDKLLDELRSLDPKECEHGRPMISNCYACDEIHKECFPENYSTCDSCGELVDPDSLDENKHCFNC